MYIEKYFNEIASELLVRREITFTFYSLELPVIACAREIDDRFLFNRFQWRNSPNKISLSLSHTYIYI